MKAFAELKRRQISTVATAPLPEGDSDYHPQSFGKPSRGRLHAVAPLAKRITAPMLTTEEFIQVRLATVRESTKLCYWPADVVARFAAADVIR